MPYEIDIQLHDNYVRAHASGKRRYGDAAFEAGQAGRKIVEFCEKFGVYNVMCVLNLEGRLSAVDSIEIVNQSKDYGWDRHYRLAFVDANEISAEDVKFTETVAVNRAYAVRHFSNEADAAAWLTR